ncbi:hypothetical protein [Actinopolymorpha alba]|nr:hypothetical protein [Actinopolymorpha alba]
MSRPAFVVLGLLVSGVLVWWCLPIGRATCGSAGPESRAALLGIVLVLM